MIKLTFTLNHNGPKLYAELAKAIPALAPLSGPDGLTAVFLLESVGTTLILTLPDGIAKAAIIAVLQAHDPTPVPLPKTARQVVRDALEAATTLAYFRAALVAYFQAE